MPTRRTVLASLLTAAAFRPELAGAQIGPTPASGETPAPATILQLQRRTIEVNGKPYLLEPAIRADFALVQAFIADYLGNLSYALTARNFNPIIAMAADTVIAGADNIVPIGVISPDHVVTPAPLVDYIVANA